MDFQGQNVEMWMDSTDLVQSLVPVFCENTNKLF